jgi:hypothetical protein
MILFDVDSVLIFTCSMDVDMVSDVSEVHVASMLMVKASSVCECSCICRFRFDRLTANFLDSFNKNMYELSLTLVTSNLMTEAKYNPKRR